MDRLSSKYKRERPTVGVLVGWQVYQGALHDFLESLFSGLRSAARERSCHLLLACGVTPDLINHIPAWPEPSPESDFVPVGPWNADGLIVVTPLLSETRSRYLQQLIATEYPIVFCGAGESGSAVIPDNEGGIRRGLAHLVEHGHQRIAFIAGIEGYTGEGYTGDSSHRLETYRAAVREYGLADDARLVAYGSHSDRGGRRAMEQILASGVEFTAVLASNDQSASGAMRALQQAGRRIPHDVAVIGFDDRVEATAQTPSLTTLHYPIVEAGHLAFELLLKHIERRAEPREIIRLPMRLVIRQSCGCLPNAIIPPIRERLEKLRRDSVSALPDAKQAESLLPQWVEVMTQAVSAEARHFSVEEVQAACQSLLEAFRLNLKTETAGLFPATLANILERVEEIDDDTHAWQAVISILKVGTPALLNAWRCLEQRSRADDLLRQARMEISEIARRQYRRYVAEQRGIADQVGLLTARLLTALDETRILETLAESLPGFGLPHAEVFFFEPEPEDPVAWSLARSRAATLPHRFPSREFPPPGLYPANEPFHLALLPLALHTGPSGFIAFEATNLLPCAAITRQLAAALHSAYLYREATEGRQLAEEANRLKSRFLSTVSHELRTPLNLIVGLSEMVLREQAQAESTSREDVERIHASARHLDGLIRDVLDLSRTEIGQLKLAREPLDLTEVLRAVVATGEQLARAKGLDWRVQIPDQLPRVSGDRTRLGQVILNLISNAVKFTERGKITLTVETIKEGGRRNASREAEISPSSFLLPPSFVLVSISDTGLGIPLEEQKVIFDEFRQSERTTARGYGGLGLGLAICKRLIELHGGEIGVRSSGAEGEGSTFFFTLPVLDLRPESAAEARAKLPTRKQTVLLLGDQPGQGERLCQHLSREGFLAEAQAVDEANTWLEEFLMDPPGAVVLDLQLAAQQGWEIMRVLKGHPAAQDIPVLFYSLAQTEEAGSLLELDYLMKPLAKAELSQALARQGWSPGDNSEKTILIVDDEPEILEMHAQMAQAQSATYRLLKARHGREALELLRRTRVDLVLLDLMMPELDGFGVLEAMRQHETTRTIPVIVLTAQVLTEEDMARLNQGVATVLGKGIFSLEETLGHIETALAHNRKLGGEAQRLVRKAMAYIHTHYPEPISRESLARYVGVSKTYLDRCFTQETGLTPMVYLNRYRINQAKALLTAGDQRVIEVALAVGFSDIAYFSRVFRREVGMPPSAYRQKRI